MQPFVAALLVFTLVHLGMTFLSVVRRLFGTYYELFASDFDPDLDEVSVPPRIADGLRSGEVTNESSDGSVRVSPASGG